MSMFDSAAVKRELPPELAERLDVRTKDITASTNLDIRELAEGGSPEGTVMIAGEQTAGRGRLGRSFWSPKDSGLYMSILLRPELAVTDSLAVTVCAAAAAADAIETLTGLAAGIKWVNDIYIDGRKVCGILTEASLKTDGSMDYAVLGIGINVSDRVFPDDIRDKAGAIGADEALRPKLAAAVLERFFAYYDRLPDKGYLSDYRRRSVLTGKRIEYERAGERLTARAVGIDDDAKLIVISPKGEEIHLGSGEVNIIMNKETG